MYDNKENAFEIAKNYELSKDEYKAEKLEKISAELLKEQGRELGYFARAENLEKIANLFTQAFTIRLPETGGEWEGERGESKWKPNLDEVPKQPPANTKTWREIFEPYGIDGIEFKDGEPDFSVVAEATVEIDDFTEERDEVFAQADEKLAEQWNAEGKDGKIWSPEDVKKYRQENKLTWHERMDMKTLDLVPQAIHANIPHTGGHSRAKHENGGKE